MTKENIIIQIKPFSLKIRQATPAEMAFADKRLRLTGAAGEPKPCTATWRPATSQELKLAEERFRNTFPVKHTR